MLDREDCGADAHGERDASPVQEPAQQVAPDVVGTEERLPAGGRIGRSTMAEGSCGESTGASSASTAHDDQEDRAAADVGSRLPVRAEPEGAGAAAGRRTRASSEAATAIVSVQADARVGDP